MNTIASAGQDGKVGIMPVTALYLYFDCSLKPLCPPVSQYQVIVWAEKPGGSWQPVLLKDFGVPAWRVSWSTTGNILAVSDANSSVTLWKEAMDGQWQCIS